MFKNSKYTGNTQEGHYIQSKSLKKNSLNFFLKAEITELQKSIS